jgi:hypothetical protein
VPGTKVPSSTHFRRVDAGGGSRGRTERQMWRRSAALPRDVGRVVYRSANRAPGSRETRRQWSVRQPRSLARRIVCRLPSLQSSHRSGSRPRRRSRLVRRSGSVKTRNRRFNDPIGDASDDRRSGRRPWTVEGVLVFSSMVFSGAERVEPTPQTYAQNRLSLAPKPGNDGIIDRGWMITENVPLY